LSCELFYPIAFSRNHGSPIWGDDGWIGWLV